MGISLEELFDVIKPLEVNLPFDIKELNGFSIDSRTIKKGEVFIAIKGDRFDGNDFGKDAVKKGALFSIVEREIDAPFVKVKDGFEALKEIAKLKLEKSNAESIAVVGSVGKTTTKELLTSFLSCCGSVHKTVQNENNVIGVAKTLIGLNNEDFCVVEVGINQKNEMEQIASFFKPDYVLFLNVSRVHLEFLKDLESVFKEKSKIITDKSFVVYNADDEILSRHFKNKDFLSFGFKKGKVKGKVVDGSVKIENLRFRLKDEINPYTLLSAFACFRAVCESESECLIDKLESFESVGYRMKFEKLRDTNFILDCYNANIDSMKYAIEKLAEKSGKKLAVLGDMLELGEYSEEIHRELGRYASNFEIDLFCVGRDAFYMCEEFGRKCEFFENKSDVVAKLENVFEEYDWILLKASRGLKLEEIYFELKERVKK
ncbi:UDP-N-acetylmuramoyl-tripeptide--D-alanyl-D-alanine ligase [Hippea alviniae]|uniref:UDP-N-acetylmuramoyl-tripeptide--D-alanyl-D- alanine ligase n=1 Tax=Hippea alviniae TaxID=1279027 RepID=UPI0003B38323|nr:UDP-N-acetylmuramoyl-tripeptide--D-alanyl-D-alanine ligase [Hippea alviniae]